MRTDKYEIGDIVEIASYAINQRSIHTFLLSDNKFEVIGVNDITHPHRTHSQLLHLRNSKGEEGYNYGGSWFKPILQEPTSNDFLESISL